MEKINLSIEERFINFVKIFGKRRSEKQKALFLENVVTMANGLNLKTEILQGKEGPVKYKSLIIGDLEKSDTLILAGYDTTERSLSNRLYYPFNDTYNRQTYLLDTTINVLIAIVIAIFAFFLIPKGNIIIRAIGLVIIVIAIFISRGLTNTATFSKSSSVFLLLELMRELNQEKMALCFADSASFSKAGIDILLKNNNINNKKIIYLDCLCKGEKVVVMATDSIKKVLDISLHKSNLNYEIIDIEKENDYRFKELNNFAHICVVQRYEYTDYFVKNARKEDDLTIDLNWVSKIKDVLKEISA